MRKYKCDIVIPVYNAAMQTRICIESIKNSLNSRYRIIVVNDNSDEYTTEILKKTDDIILLENEQNLGFLGSANRGLLYSDTEYVCLLNSDTVIVDAQWLDKMIAYADSHPDVGLISPLSNEAVNLSIRLHPGSDIHLMGELIDKYSARKYPDAVTVVGFCLLVKRAVIEKIGGFDEAFGKGYCEESDYHYRAMEAGFTCKVADDVFLYHEGEGSFSTQREERYTRNRRLFDERWLGNYERDICRFNQENVLSYLRNDDFLLKTQVVHEEYDVLFVMLSFETYGGVVVAVDLVNSLILKGKKANIVYLRRAEKTIDIERYFEPLHIPEEELTERMPKARVYVATHYRTVMATARCAHAHKAKAVYFIQDDERKFEGENVELAEASYAVIPVHVYVSNWLDDTLGRFAIFKKVVSNGIYRDLFYPGPKAGPDDMRVDIAMMTRMDRKRGYYEGMTVINRLLLERAPYLKPFFHLFGNREVYSHEIRTDRYKYYGIVGRKKVADILRKCDILIDPSHFQGFGLTALEAMSSGCACVLPRKGGGNDFAVHMENALLFDGNNIDDLFEKVNILLDCPNLRIRIQKNALNLQDKFDINCSSMEFLDLMEDAKHLPDIPSQESVPFLKTKLILLEEQSGVSRRKDAQIFYLKTELEQTKENFRFYMDEYHNQKRHIAQLEETLAQERPANADRIHE